MQQGWQEPAEWPRGKSDTSDPKWKMEESLDLKWEREEFTGQTDEVARATKISSAISAVHVRLEGFMMKR